MLKLHCTELWPTISKLAKESAHRHAAVAYVSDDTQLSFGKGDTLIADASDAAIRTGQTSAKVLHRAFLRGAKVFSCPGLHAKVMVFDGTAVIGSANISKSSSERLFEAAILSDNPALVSASRRVLHQLQGSSMRLRDQEIAALLRVPVTPRVFVQPRKRRFAVEEPRSGATWLVGTRDLKDSQYQNEQTKVEQGLAEARNRLGRKSSAVDAVRYARNANIARLGREGDWVIQMRHDKWDGKVIGVYRRAPILYKQDERSWVRIYVEDFAKSDDEVLGWREFQRIARQAEIPERRMRPRSTGMLTEPQAEVLESLWKAALARRR